MINFSSPNSLLVVGLIVSRNKKILKTKGLGGLDGVGTKTMASNKHKCMLNNSL